LAWRRLDAWSPDTDGDGVADNSDFEPSTNVRTRVSLTAVSVQDNADGGCGWPAGADNYWVLSLNGNQVTTVVRWDFICTSDGTKELRVYFTWDVPDSLASVSVVVQGWDQDVFSGEHYDLRPVSGVNDFSTTWTVPGYGDTQTTTSGGDYPRQTLTIRIGDNSDGFVLFFTHREVAPGNVYESIFS